MMNLKYILIIYIFNNIGPPFYVSHRGLQNLETGLDPGDSDAEPDYDFDNDGWVD
jgi:hypothetical protein